VAEGSGRFPVGGPLPPLTDLPANGLARTPPMIWGAWYGFTTTINDTLIREMARAMVSTGLRDAGYDILNMEVGWPGQRDADGNMRANRKFPDMKRLCDYVHSLGLKVGICTSPGPYDCTGYAGSLNHEEQDARTWAQWGIDFIKHDACSVNTIYPHQSRRVYQKMGNALQKCGRPILYALCQYGEDNVWEWGASVGANMWRTYGDIADDWESVSQGFDMGELAPHAGPGHWNDLDYLMIGMGRLSMEEYRTQFSLWCMLAAPLINSVDLRNLQPDVRAILLHKGMIAIDQDRRGVQGRRVARSGDTEIWLKPLQEGHAVALFNRGEKEATVQLDTESIGLQGVREARDVWDGRDLVLEKGCYAARVPSHGSVVLRLP
jgi:alpha-galactosidase